MNHPGTIRPKPELLQAGLLAVNYTAAMDHDIQFHPQAGYVQLTTSGEASVEGFQRMHREMIAHERWRRGLNLLMDHRRLDSTGLRGTDVQRMSMWRGDLRNLPDGVKIATVVETDLGFGLMRMWETLTEGVLRAEHRIFRSLDEAKEWLEAAAGSGAGSRADPARGLPRTASARSDRKSGKE